MFPSRVSNFYGGSLISTAASKLEARHFGGAVYFACANDIHMFKFIQL